MSGLGESRLDVLRYKQIDGIRIYINTLDYRTPHFHKDIELILVLDGDLDIQSETFHYVAEKGDMILCNSGEAHEFKKVTKSCTLVGCHIEPGIVKSEVPEFEQIRFADYNLKKRLPEELYHQVTESFLDMALYYFEQPEHYKLFCVAQAKYLIYLFLREVPYRILADGALKCGRHHNDRLQRLIQFVEENYMNKICLTDFAESEGMSMSYMSHFIKKTIHQSFQEYVNTVRFNAACKMLAADQMKMIDICFRSGFSDYKYFSGTFVSRTGMTPEVYRKHMIASRNTYMEDHERNKFHYTIQSVERFYSSEKSAEIIKTKKANLSN